MTKMTFDEVKVTRFAQRAAGMPTQLYVTALPIESIINRLQVDVYDAGQNPEGYQRRPIENRFKEVARYVEEHEGLLPTAILVNFRDDVKFVPDDESDKGSITQGVLRIPSDTIFWVVDGQHRVYGLQEAARRLKRANSEAMLSYDVPLVFTVGVKKLDEMRLFHIVNSKAKSVPTDLAAALLLKAVQQVGKEFVHSGKGDEKAFRKAVGTKIAYHLTETPGPWQGKIRLPNELLDKKNKQKKPLQVNAIASSLDTALRDPYLRTIFEPETDEEWPTLRGVVYTYWSALAQLMPDAFADIDNYSVQRTAGAYTFDMILPDVVYRCRDRGDFSVKTFKEILSSLNEWVESETWHKDRGDPVTQSTGMSAIRKLADKMRESLPKVDTPGLEMPEEVKVKA